MLVAVGVYAYPHIFQTVNSRLARLVEKELNVHLNRIGLCSRIKTAQFVEGKGIQINGINLACSQGDTLAGIESAFIHAPVQLPELISSNFQPTAVELVGATLHITRDQKGRWDLQDILSSLSRIPPTKQKPVPIIIRDSRIIIVDLFQSPRRTLELSNLEFQLNPLEDDPTKLAAAGTITGFRNGRFSFRFIPDDTGSQIDFRLTELPINNTTVGFLPPGSHPEEIRAVVGSISGKGSVHINAENRDFERLQFDGEIKRGSIDHAAIPHLIANCQGPLKVDNNVLSGKLTGWLGTAGQFGQFDVSFANRLKVKPLQWQAKGKVNNLKIASNLACYFDTAVQKFFADFEPEGIIDVDFDLAHDQNGLSKKVDAVLKDMAFQFVRFPFPVQHATGTANLRGDQFWFDLSAIDQNQPLGLKGTVKGKGPTAEIKVDFWNEGPIPINRKLANAVAASPQIARTVFDFHPGGFVKVYGQLNKSADEQRGILDYDIELIDCNAQHVHFPYPITGINGMLLVRDGQVRIKEVSGVGGPGTVDCSGSWDTTQGLDLKFDAYNVGLDQQLADALKPDVRYVWDSIRPSGIAHHVHVELTSPAGKNETNVVVESALANPENRTGSQVSIQPYWFPYQLQNLDGRVFVGNGKVKLNLAQGRHKNTWVSCLGDGNYDLNSWNLGLSRLRVGSLVVDDDLLNAVPDSLRQALIGLDYQGSLNGSGTVNLHGSTPSRTAGSSEIATLPRSAPQNGSDDKGSFEMDWDVRLDMDRASLNVGMVVQNVFGSVDLAGRYDGESVRCNGSIDVESVHWQDMQITNIRGPLYIEDQRVGVGSMAKSDEEISTPLSLTGNLFGGTVRLDAQRWSHIQDQFFVQASVSDMDIQRAGQQMAPSLHEVGGTANLAFRVGGGNTLESMQGEGIFQLRNANIYELPVVLSMLKMMKTRKRDRVAFDASNVDFTIQGDSLNLTKMELLGDAISLIGKGKMNMEHEIDLDFYTVAGRNRVHIPIISDLAKASSQQILWLKVDGSLESPQVHSKLLPGLNQSVQQLFQTEEVAPPRYSRAPTSNADMFR